MRGRSRLHLSEAFRDCPRELAVGSRHPPQSTLRPLIARGCPAGELPDGDWVPALRQLDQFRVEFAVADEALILREGTDGFHCGRAGSVTDQPRALR